MLANYTIPHFFHFLCYINFTCKILDKKEIMLSTHRGIDNDNSKGSVFYTVYQSVNLLTNEDIIIQWFITIAKRNKRVFMKFVYVKLANQYNSHDVSVALEQFRQFKINISIFWEIRSKWQWSYNNVKLKFNKVTFIINEIILIRSNLKVTFNV